jgi:hypothetical protein
MLKINCFIVIVNVRRFLKDYKPGVSPLIEAGPGYSLVLHKHWARGRYTLNLLRGIQLKTVAMITTSYAALNSGERNGLFNQKSIVRLLSVFFAI